MKKIYLIVLAALCSAACNDTHYYRISGYAQGGTWQVKYRGARLSPDRVQAGVDSLLREIDFTISGYNKASLLSRLNAGDSVVLNQRFLELYEHSYRMWEASQGAFDVASGPLFDIWGFGFTGDSLPSAKAVQDCLEDCGTGRLISPDGMRSLLGEKITARQLLRYKDEQALPRLNFNAIAQGYSCDVVADYLHGLGVSDMLVDIGEIYCCGLNPSGKGWSIGIDNPVDGNNTPGADIKDVWTSDGGSHGVVTSGNYRKFYVRDGKMWMFYAGAYNNAPQQIGVAVSTDGIHFKRMSDTPFKPVGKPGEWNSSESGHPHLFCDSDGRTYLFYQGNNDNGKTWLLTNEEVLWNPDGTPSLK